MKRVSTSKILVVDKFIPLSMQERYKTWILGGQFPWYYTPDVTFAYGGQQRPSMSHGIILNGEKTSNLDVDFLGHLGAEKYGWQFNVIAHAKTILQFPLNPEIIGTEVDSLHTDISPHIPHLVVLYYVLDADGDTIIVDSVNKGEAERPSLSVKDHKILQRVTPKQGRAVLFDGSYYHTAEQPKNGMRCIINLNVC